MSSVWSRPLVEALAGRRGQAASCHAGLRCHALSSDWVTVQIEKVTVSRQHGCHSHLLPLQKRTYTHTHTHLIIPGGKLRSFETCVCLLFLSGVFSICAMLSHQSEIIAGCQSAIYWESGGKRVYDSPRCSESICPVLLSSVFSQFISVTLLKCSPRVWSCQCCSFPGNQSHTAGQISAHVENNSNSCPCSDIKYGKIHRAFLGKTTPMQLHVLRKYTISQTKKYRALHVWHIMTSCLFCCFCLSAE